MSTSPPLESGLGGANDYRASPKRSVVVVVAGDGKLRSPLFFPSPPSANPEALPPSYMLYTNWDLSRLLKEEQLRGEGGGGGGEEG